MGSCCFGVSFTTLTSFETTGTTGAVTIGFGSDLMTAGKAVATMFAFFAYATTG
jgi:sugar phosphate permease